MFTGYTVGVRLALEDMVSAPLLRISEQFKSIDIALAGITANLRELGVGNSAMKGLANSSLALDKHLSSANIQTERLEKNLAAIKALGMSGGTTVPVPVGIPRSGGGGRGGFRNEGGLHVGPGGVGMTGATFGLGEAMIPLAVAGAAAWGSSKFYDAAKDYQTEVARLTLFGLSQAQIASAQAYITNLKTNGTSQAQNMRFFTEAQGVFRETGLGGEDALTGAKLATPWMSKIYYATAALDDASRDRMITSSMAMLRFIEQMGGVKDPALFNRLAEGGWKAIRASGGVVDWEQYRQFSARAGIAGQFIDPDQLFGGLEPIIGELKGSTAGYAQRTAYNRIAGIIRVPNQVAHILADSGVWDKSKIEWNSMGGIKRFKGNPLSSEMNSMYLHRPIDFYEKVILPMYAKMNGGKGLTIEERARQNALIFGSTGGNEFTKIDIQLKTIHKSMEAYKKALGLDDSAAVVDKTAVGAEAQFTQAWTDFKNEFGKDLLPKITAMLQSGTELMRDVTGFFERNKWARDLMDTKNMMPKGGDAGMLMSGASWLADQAKGLVFGLADSGKQGDVYIDGKKAGVILAPHVSDAQARAAAKPQSGASHFDGRMTPAHVGATGNW